MPIRFTYDPERQILFTTAQGPVSLEDIQNHLDQEKAAHLLNRREIFDATSATTTLTADEVRELVWRVRTLLQSGPFGPTAVITTNPTFFGMAMMFAILCELDSGPRVAVFRSFEDGLAWLHGTNAAPANRGSTPAQ
jgi:hypothetical protein